MPRHRRLRRRSPPPPQREAPEAGAPQPVLAGELSPRDDIRDLVARYNAYGDGGKFDLLLDLFVPTAVMEVGGRSYEGPDEIATIFTGAQTTVLATSGIRPHIRHFTSTHVIDLEDDDHATGRCYFQVLMAHGLDHWGRYVDGYVRDGEGHWRFERRRVTIDGRVPGSVFAPSG